MKIKLRPLKLAFLVRPVESKALAAAIETASFLWGGAYNPIVPIYDRLPKTWGRDRKHAPNAKTVAE